LPKSSEYTAEKSTPRRSERIIRKRWFKGQNGATQKSTKEHRLHSIGPSKLNDFARSSVLSRGGCREIAVDNGNLITMSHPPKQVKTDMSVYRRNVLFMGTYVCHLRARSKLAVRRG
jgi:hypothetical protein